MFAPYANAATENAIGINHIRIDEAAGVLAETLRTWPGALRSRNPGASMVAIGARARWLTADHPYDYGYGPGSPLAKLVEADGSVALLGSDLDQVTLLHLSEHLAELPNKRVVRRDFRIDGVERTTTSIILSTKFER